MHAPKWSVSDNKILKRSEIGRVLCELHRKAPRSVNTRQTLILFRLTCCCGLRVSEACGLKLRDVRVNVERPYLKIPKAIAKGRKTKKVNGQRVKVGNNATARHVPLWWDQGTLDDLRAWKREREQHGATASDYFLCSQQRNAFGKRLDRRNARTRFIRACAVLGQDRAADITIHHGRHSFISHALAGGRSLAEVAQAAGHANITMTAIYTHVAVDDDEIVGDLFNFTENGEAHNEEKNQEHAKHHQQATALVSEGLRSEHLPTGAGDRYPQQHTEPVPTRRAGSEPGGGRYAVRVP